MIGWADGDARRFLNVAEPCTTAAAPPKINEIAGDFAESTLSQNLRRFDKGGEAFYDQISALHKSVRGSNPDAALYWFIRMLDGGADPLYLARRIVRMAWEDIGLADPRAGRIALDACETFERSARKAVDGHRLLSIWHAAKSNAAYMAYNEALSFVKSDGSRPVPIHLRNAPTKLMKGYGGAEYRYAHNELNAYAAGEDYMPEGMPAVSWYEPTDRGKLRRKSPRSRHLERAFQDRTARGRRSMNERVRNNGTAHNTRNTCSVWRPRRRATRLRHVRLRGSDQTDHTYSRSVRDRKQSLQQLHRAVVRVARITRLLRR